MTGEVQTILLAEADILIRHPLAQYLRECGFTVLEAQSDAEAREILADEETRVDVLFVDAELDGRGFALAAWARERSVETIIASSPERAASEARDLCHEGPALAKPYEHHIVLDQIRQLLAARQRKPKG